MNTVSLSGINFYKGTHLGCFSELKDKIEARISTLVVTPNPEMLYEASRDGDLLGVLQNANLALPDGAGIFVAYQISQSTLPPFLKWIALPVWCFRAIVHSHSFAEKYGERITGSRLTRDLINYATQEKIPVTIIDPIVTGDTDGDKAKKASQEKIQTILASRYPGIVCSVIISDTVPEKLPEHGIVFATHGNGKQEKTLNDIIQKHPQCGLCMGVGGSIDLLTGFRQPAPAFFQRFGSEWLYRLYKNPSRHWKRMKKVISFLLSQI